MTSLLGASYERVSCLAARLSVTQDELLERFDENHRKAVETERVAKALAMGDPWVGTRSQTGRRLYKHLAWQWREEVEKAWTDFKDHVEEMASKTQESTAANWGIGTLASA